MKPNKALGQNFLCDENLCQWMVRQLQLEQGEQIVEIGPGLGALTAPLIQFAGSERKLTLIEKDNHFIDHLQKRFSTSNVEICSGDAINFDKRQLYPQGPAKLMANLPYYAACPILLNFASHPTPITRFVITLQKEVADRLMAKPSTPQYGCLTLAIGLHWKVGYLKTLSPSVFYPQPAIDSAVISLSPRAPGELPPCSTKAFNHLIRLGFSQRRKQLKKLLPAIEASWSAIAGALGISPTARAEELDLHQWVALCNLFTEYSAGRIRTAQAGKNLAQDPENEIFDVVDENDRIVGEASRRAVHEKELRHRAVHIFIYNRQGELFLQKRSIWKDKYPGRWDSSAAGHLNAGSTYDESADRELAEELGIEHCPLQFLAKLPASPATGMEFIQLYRGEYHGELRLAPPEIEAGEFFPLPLIQEWVSKRPEDFAPGFLQCLAAS